MNRRVLLTGCSGGGKSTLIAALADRGLAVVSEPGRRIVAREIAAGGRALPWIDMAAFARLALDTAIADHEAAAGAGDWIVFDRGVIDAAVALAHAEDTRWPEAAIARRYHPAVFLAPPWPGIFAADGERRHDFAEAVAEYERIAAALPMLGYEPIVLPLGSVDERVTVVLSALAA